MIHNEDSRLGILLDDPTGDVPEEHGDVVIAVAVARLVGDCLCHPVEDHPDQPENTVNFMKVRSRLLRVLLSFKADATTPGGSSRERSGRADVVEPFCENVRVDPEIHQAGHDPLGCVLKIDVHHIPVCALF